MRGKLGVSTVTHKMKKPKRVACDCERCKHSNKYWGVKPKKKRGKGK